MIIRYVSRHLDNEEFEHEVSPLPRMGFIRLELEDNRLGPRLPPSVCTFENVTHVFLESNRLEAFPVELCALRRLEYLTLANNRISGRLPVEIKQMKRLLGLDLRMNSLTNVKALGGSLPNLQELNLQNNPALMEDVAVKGGQELLRHIQSDYEMRAMKCKRAVRAMALARLRKGNALSTLQKDIFKIILRMVWETHEDELWNKRRTTSNLAVYM